MKLIAGLGNPGEEYEKTRHNAGFRVADRFAAFVGEKSGARVVKFKRGYFGAVAVVEFPSFDTTAILKPKTFMNRSGRSVARAMRENEIEIGSLVVVHDDMDLPFGKIKVKYGGGSGGHKGVQNISEVMGSADFIRLRIGIDKPPGKDTTNYVLGEFNSAESALLKSEVLPLAVEALTVILTDGYQTAMNKFNSR